MNTAKSVGVLWCVQCGKQTAPLFLCDKLKILTGEASHCRVVCYETVQSGTWVAAHRSTAQHSSNQCSPTAVLE